MKTKLYELTNPQKSILYTEEYYKGTPINNICCSVIIYEKVDIELLKKALFILIQTNDSFRIRLSNKADVPMQYISDFTPFEIEVSSAKNEEEFKSIENDFVKYNFDLYNENLFKFKIVSFPDQSAGVILNVHHLISDSWSLGLTTQEILKIYHSILNNTIIIQENNSYINYITKEQDYKTSPKYIADQAYWNNLFDVVPDSVSIHSAKSKNDDSIMAEAKRLNFSISANILEKIAYFCKQNRFSQLDFFIAVFSVYIYNVCNSNDFVIGTPILNRTGLIEKNTTGMFVNTIPIRINFKNSVSFVDLTQSISNNMIGNLRHQKYSYNSILEDLRNKNGNIQPLYNIMLSYQITKAYNPDLGNYKTDWIFNNYNTNDIAIHLLDANNTGELNINYDYLTSKYNEQDISDLHNRIMHIIEQIIEKPNINLNQIEILTQEEKNKILYEFNNTSMPYPKDKTIIDLFEEQVEKNPDNVALIFENQKLTYKELNEKANSLAHYLRFKKNIVRNEFVGIMVNRSFEMIVSVLAVLKSGAAYIPIDPTYPKDRIDYMLKNSNAQILLTQDNLKNKIRFENIIVVDLPNSEIYNNNFCNLEHINNCDDTSYVIFTSGSTGNPKGVMINHKNIVNFVCGMQKEFNLTHNDIIASITTISFDIFVLESLLPLSIGSQIVIANENEQVNADAFNELCINNNVNIFQTTPSRLQTFLVASNLDFVKKCDKILVGGEPFPEQLLNKLKQLSSASIYNMYGPTETTVWSSYKKLESEQNITIGKPIINTQIYILNSNLLPLPVNIPGDIYISGDGVGKGYLNKKELTDKVFIKNPFVDNSIMYKTGDVGYFNSYGEIVCLGRSDNQIKLRGLRIELGEIENIIQNYPNINKAIVTKQTDDLHEYLCAYFTSNIEINTEEISKYLEQFLPKYMIPKYFMQMKEFPHTPNGKTDRKALPKINYTNNKKSFANPRNEYDVKLIKILQNILHTDNISINDDFFELGGDSLSAITLSSYIKKDFGVQLYVKDILNNSKISTLSDLISTDSLSAPITIKPIAKSDFYNVSSAQKRIYFASQIDGSNSILYNIPGGIIFESELDIVKLEKCINIIIERQESLRTYFEIENENVVQKIKDNIDFKLNVLDNVNFENIDSIFNDFVKPFDLSKAPLFRIEYLKFSNKKNALFIDMHHIISDGTSLSIFIDELIKLYNNITLPDLNIQYKDYATYEYKKIKSECFKEDKLYWLSQFQDEPPVLNLPTQFSRPSNQSFIGKKIYSLIDKETTKKIQTICKNLEMTPYMFLLACYYILISKYTSQDDIVIGSPIVGRDIAETYNIIGMFVNTLALRNKIDQSDSFKAFILNVKNNLLNAFNHQTYPFDELVKDLNISRDTSRNPLFDIMFIYQNNGYNEITIQDTTATYYIPDTNISKFDLSIEAVPQHNTIHLTFEYATSLFTDDFIKNMSIHYLNTINSVVDNLDIQIKNIDILSPEERHTILYDFNNTSTDYPKDKTIIDLFEEQVNKTPDDIAVVFENQKLTYKELNEKANSLAFYLKNTLNIKSNDIVGVMVNRSLEVIISILAVLKAGGAYIPIDPTFPQERIDYMLSNSNTKVLLSQNNLLNKINFKNVVYVDLENNSIYNLPNINLKNSNLLEDLMYIIYTSGSTGKPKGVMITHKVFINFTNYCNNYVEYLKHPLNHTIVSITTISFDIFAYETLISLQKGLKVVLANENQQITPHLLNALMEENNVDIIQSTPSIMQIFINNLKDIPALRSIKYAILAGEQLPLNLVENLHNLSNMIIYNGYGPSETYYCTLTELNNKNIVTIGKPISNSQMYILDKNLQPVPIGVIGEIYISGDCVGMGYLNNPSLTTNSFIPNPFIKNTIMYKSGDLGKYLKDGNIICLGRSDHQIKIRGLRIELQEIEAVMMRYPNIQKVAVIKQSIRNREFISAYYVSNKRISIPNFRKYISNFLPNYMIPSYYTVLDDLPYTPNGKIDKKSLPFPSEITNTNKVTYQPPQTDIQKELVKIFQEILNTKPIGIYDNFFELGGDSLLAMNLNIELSKLTNKITYQDIFRFPTVSELEQIILKNNKSSLYNKIEDLPDGIMHVLSNTKKIEIQKNNTNNNILLTGSTGFLGIHILEQLLHVKNAKIYCLIRPETGLTPETKLKQKLNYYFDDKYTHLINKKIYIIEGDICKPNFGLSHKALLSLANNIDILINSAANVSHFGDYNNFYETNVLSVKYMINFCKNYNKKLYHISTIGVSGLTLDKSYLIYKNQSTTIFDESSLYIGQEPETVYSYTKFQAEILLLNEISKGLDAYILRMGNLMPRYRDGKFQENVSDNEFINKLIAFIKIKSIPDYLAYYQLEFTPVDYAAKAICKVLTNYTKINRVFHLYNNKTISTKKCLKLLRKLGYNVNILKEKDFIMKIKTILKDNDSKQTIKYLLNDFDKNTHIDYKSSIIVRSNFSKRYLRKTLFFWPKISKKYLIRFFDILKEVM